MRFVLVAAIWVVLVGGLSLYSYQRDRHKPPPWRPGRYARRPVRRTPWS